MSDIEYIAKNVIFLNHSKVIQQAPPKQLVNELEGKVWECAISDQEFATYQVSYAISNIQYNQSSITIRCISQEKPHTAAINVQPNLEDSYVYYFGTH
ncbi:hypothetical protein [Lysinibacillus sp. LZ02]|uniref:hypothetical protein n=1 Tax=Lysinibacillus sp. LZ02 TaxID=3420668 RepID=UPI003D35E3CE